MMVKAIKQDVHISAHTLLLLYSIFCTTLLFSNVFYSVLQFFIKFLVKFLKRSIFDVPITTNMFLGLEYCCKPLFPHSTLEMQCICVLFCRLGMSWFLNYILLFLLQFSGMLIHYSWSNCFLNQMERVGPGWVKVSAIVF